MNRFLLRIESVNLSWFIEDTDDLSTIRGGGLLLLRSTATKEKDQFDEGTPPVARIPGIREISTGASTGLYMLETADESPDAAVRKLRQEFATHKAYMHATVVADAIPESEDFVADGEKLIALNRWRQMQEPTFVVPLPATPPVGDKSPLAREVKADTKPHGACEYDGVRPGVKEVERADGNHWVSESTKVRFDFGREEKKKRFYEVTAPRGTMEEPWGCFTNDFEELADYPSAGKLNGKMAVIYADGNSFGKFQAKHCRDSEKLTAWDVHLKKFRQDFLTRLLSSMPECPEGDRNGNAWHAPPSGRKHSFRALKRIEVLMWGGDEFLMVVPAWQGLAAVREFLREPLAFADTSLSHAIGVVFCNYKAPIRRVVKLAQELSDVSKEVSKDWARAANVEQASDLIAYQVLESFDHIGRDLRRFMHDRVGEGNDIGDLLLSKQAIKGLEKGFRTLREHVPRRKAHELAQAATPEKSGVVTEKLDKVWASLARSARNPSTDAYLALDKLLRRVPQEQPLSMPAPATFIHAVELWDYAAPLPEEADATATKEVQQ